MPVKNPNSDKTGTACQLKKGSRDGLLHYTALIGF
jgi:hypothetical protein